MRRLALASLCALMLGAPLGAQTVRELPPEQERVAREAFIQLRSPVTPSHTLDMCPADQAIALRDTIRVAALAGMGTAQIVDDVVARYGAEMRILPRRSGKDLVAWLLTPLALLGGALFVVLRLRHMREDGPPPPDAGPGTSLSDEERSMLDEALRAFEAAETEEVS